MVKDKTKFLDQGDGSDTIRMQDPQNKPPPIGFFDTLHLSANRNAKGSGTTKASESSAKNSAE